MTRGGRDDKGGWADRLDFRGRALRPRGQALRAMPRMCALTPSSAGSASIRRIRASSWARRAGSSQRAAKSGSRRPGPSTPSRAVRRQARLGHLGAQLVGQVEVGRGEVARVVGRVAVLAVARSWAMMAAPAGIVDQAVEEAVEERGEARDDGGDDHAAGAHDACGLAQRLHAVHALGQVVERAEEQHGIGARRRAAPGGGRRPRWRRPAGASGCAADSACAWATCRGSASISVTA